MDIRNVKIINKIKECIFKIGRAYKAGGILLIIKRAFKKCFETNSANWLERDLTLPIPEFKPKISLEVSLQAWDETISWLKKEDRDWMLTPQELETAFKPGHLFPNVKSNGEIIGSIKVGAGKVFILDFKKYIEFPKEIAFHTDIYVLPEYRDLGIASYLLSEVMKSLKDNGFKKIRCHIPPWNVSSLKVHTRVGFKKIRYIRFLRILGFKILTDNPAKIIFKKSENLFARILLFIKINGLQYGLKNIINKKQKMFSRLKKIRGLIILYSRIVYIFRYFYRKLYHNPIKILYTHRIIDIDDELYSLLKDLDYLTIDEFKRRIEYLYRHYRFISLRQALDYREKGNCPANCVVLTFDDGYKCLYKKALPVLRKYKIPATVFVSTGPISDGSILWYDQLLYMIGKAEVGEFSLPFIPGKTYKVNTDADKKEVFCELVQHLKRIEFSEMEQKLEIIREKLKINKEELSKNELMLTWNEIKEMKETGLISFGAHTVHHPILTKMNIENAKYEIRESKRVMEEKLGLAVEQFAYPNGDYNTKIENIVKSSGYACACTTMEENGNTEFNPFTLGRGGFTHEPFNVFGLRMAGVFDMAYYLGDSFKNAQYWLPGYISNRLKNTIQPAAKKKPRHIYLSICDHFEPLWGGVSYEVGLSRVKRWVENYPALADKHKDSDGNIPKYTFFFPIEEYEPEYLNMLSDLCHKGYGEVEIHLHHDNDTADNLRKQLIDFKTLLADKYKLLSRDKTTGEIKYGFIHGNWALDNSRPDGRYCGINNELQILEETGCYADFSMPSAPDVTQTAKVNSIYYAIDNPEKPKSHNFGIDVKRGENNQQGLLMVQGPLLFNWHREKRFVFPSIENSCIDHSDFITMDRIRLWLDANIHVKGMPNIKFIKLYTHGCQEKNTQYLLEQGLDSLFTCLEGHYNDGEKFILHYVSAREMVNVIKAIEDSVNLRSIASIRDYKMVRL